MPVKDKVGVPGDPLNKRKFFYIEHDADEAVRISVKDEAWKQAALTTALGWTETMPAGKKIIRQTMTDAVKDQNLVPVTITYENETSTGIIRESSVRTVAGADVDLDALMAGVSGFKYHGTLQVTNIRVGWGKYPK